ncbi:MAG: hypothetical protein WC455_13825 [Dehalococcoidia bacterium]|jgi:hypothetical protein
MSDKSDARKLTEIIRADERAKLRERAEGRVLAYLCTDECTETCYNKPHTAKRIVAAIFDKEE